MLSHEQPVVPERDKHLKRNDSEYHHAFPLPHFPHMSAFTNQVPNCTCPKNDRLYIDFYFPTPYLSIWTLRSDRGFYDRVELKTWHGPISTDIGMLLSWTRDNAPKYRHFYTHTHVRSLPARTAISLGEYSLPCPLI